MDPTIRSHSLGGAFAGVADDAGSLYWNPSGLQRMERSEVTLSHSVLYGEQTLEGLTVVRPVWWRQKRQTWGVSVSHLADPSFDVVLEGESQGRARPQETVAGLGWSCPMGIGSLGVNAKYVRQELFQQAGAVWALDAGVQGHNNRRWLWGVSMANLGPNLEVGSTEVKLPLTVRLGAGVRFFSRGASGLLLSTQADLPADDKVQLRVGGEYAVSLGQGWRAAVRGGYRSLGKAPLVAGAGLERGSLGLDYSYSPTEDLGDSHRMGLTFRWGAPLPQEARVRGLVSRAQEAVDAKDWMKANKVLDELQLVSPRSREGAALRTKTALGTAESVDPEVLLDQARRWMIAGDLEKAEVAYRKVLLVQPAEPLALEGLKKVTATLAQRREQEARRALERAKTKEIHDLVRNAQLANDEGQWTKAAGIWQRVLKREPTHAVARAGMDRCREGLYRDGESAELAGRIDAARAAYRAAQEGLTTFRDSAERLNRLAEIEASARAAQSRAQLLEAQKKYEEGRSLYRQGDVAKALQLFEEAVRRAPANMTYRRALERTQKEAGGAVQ